MYRGEADHWDSLIIPSQPYFSLNTKVIIIILILNYDGNHTISLLNVIPCKIINKQLTCTKDFEDSYQDELEIELSVI